MQAHTQRPWQLFARATSNLAIFSHSCPKEAQASKTLVVASLLAEIFSQSPDTTLQSIALLCPALLDPTLLHSTLLQFTLIGTRRGWSGKEGKYVKPDKTPVGDSETRALETCEGGLS